MCTNNCGGCCKTKDGKQNMSSFGLTPDQQKFYQDNGYVLVKGVFPKAEVASVRQELHDLTTRLSEKINIDATWASERNKGTQILHCHGVQCHLASVARLIIDPRLTSLMQGCVGPNVQLHHTKMFIKPPEKGSAFPMHQDHPYFPHERHTMAAAVVHFDDATPQKGCIAVYPGSHKLGPISPDNPKDRSLAMQNYPLEKATLCPAEAGDVLIFNYLTIHGSGINTSSEARTTLLVQFRDPTDKPMSEGHKSLCQGMMLAGVDPSAAVGAGMGH